MREQFEKLPEIAKRLISVNFNTTLDRYEAKSPVLSDCNDAALYLNGAWYAYQERQKEIDTIHDVKQKIVERVIELSAEIEKLENRIRRMG